MQKWKDGFIIDDMVIWGNLDKSGYATKAFSITPTDLKNSKNEIINHFGRSISRLFTSWRPPMRIQVKWGVNSDYSDMLEHYNNVTDFIFPGPEWTSYNKEQVLKRFEELDRDPQKAAKAGSEWTYITRKEITIAIKREWKEGSCVERN